jgi:hypothetical protein
MQAINDLPKFIRPDGPKAPAASLNAIAPSGLIQFFTKDHRSL